VKSKRGKGGGSEEGNEEEVEERWWVRVMGQGGGNLAVSPR
jgi:hypothetical protein